MQIHATAFPTYLCSTILHNGPILPRTSDPTSSPEIPGPRPKIWRDEGKKTAPEGAVLVPLSNEVSDLLSQTCIVPLRINEEKTTHCSVKNGRFITGLVITSDGRISIGRERKRLLRSEVHRYITGQLPKEEHDALRGYLAFLNSVEPEHLERLIASYGAEKLRDLCPFMNR